METVSIKFVNLKSIVTINPYPKEDLKKVEKRLTCNGIGLFASSLIKKDEVIIVCEPLSTLEVKDNEHRDHPGLLWTKLIIDEMRSLATRNKEEYITFLDKINLLYPRDKAKDGQELTMLIDKKLALNRFGSSMTHTLYYTGSFINHSCDPNCLHSWYNKHEQIVIALRDIQKNEELRLTYIDLTNKDKADRQKELKDKWGFDCQCSLCVSKK
jgi:SET domain-containing protein